MTAERSSGTSVLRPRTHGTGRRSAPSSHEPRLINSKPEHVVKPPEQAAQSPRGVE